MHKKINILLVDDQKDQLLVLRSILEEENRHFIAAHSGAEALLLCELEKIDLVLLDYCLGDMNGLEVARALRSKKSTAHIPIVMVTGIAPEEHPTFEDFEWCTIDLLCKPLDPEETRAKVYLYEELAALRKQVNAARGFYP
ncbi:MAG: response regulator [Bacteroidia bacterium]|nr:response regulator [Bacteroidia bacterium]